MIIKKTTSTSDFSSFFKQFVLGFFNLQLSNLQISKLDTQCSFYILWDLKFSCVYIETFCKVLRHSLIFKMF